MRTIILILSVMVGCSGALFADTAYDQLKKGAAGGDIFDGQRAKGAADLPALKARVQPPQANVTAAEVQQKAQQQKTESFLKKAAPYAYIGGVALFMGWALLGFTAPALLFAGTAAFLAIGAMKLVH